MMTHGFLEAGRGLFLKGWRGMFLDARGDSFPKANRSMHESRRRMFLKAWKVMFAKERRGMILKVKRGMFLEIKRGMLKASRGMLLKASRGVFFKASRSMFRSMFLKASRGMFRVSETTLMTKHVHINIRIDYTPNILHPVPSLDPFTVAYMCESIHLLTPLPTVSQLTTPCTLHHWLVPVIPVIHHWPPTYFSLQFQLHPLRLHWTHIFHCGS